MMRSIELLAPAKDLETARVAIAHGADAVYIGAPKHGARASAGVPIEDLRVLCQEAHRYGVKVYVTLNTILYDHELDEAQTLIWEIYRAGADAIIVQDMGITMMHLPPIPLHSSTQCDTTEPEDAQLLEALGFEQIVLARELNVEQIRRIRMATSRPLEVFVHGALCVSYSGRCYLSHALTERSANRGECSQQCRLPYDLRDSLGTLVRQGEHLLSPRDMNRTEYLEALLEAGVSSFKIEGRLKGISYVKNIVAHYRAHLDAIIARYPDRYRRASYGRISVRFEPNPLKSFNRGFTSFMFRLGTPDSPNESVINRHSPKSQGEYIGTITSSKRQSWQIDTKTPLANGDGLLYITPSGEVGGIKVNKAGPSGQVELARREVIPVGSRVWRNYDHEFERMLSGRTATRLLPVHLHLRAISWGLALEVTSVEDPGLSVTVTLAIELEQAKHLDEARLKAELCKSGDTILGVEAVHLGLGDRPPFIPMSLLARLRRQGYEAFTRAVELARRPDTSPRTMLMKTLDRAQLPHRAHFVADYRANIANRLARDHYRAMGYSDVRQAYELEACADAALMTTKHCIRHELGYCTRETLAPMPYREPLYLEQGGNRLRLEFDCARCQMRIYRS